MLLPVDLILFVELLHLLVALIAIVGVALMLGAALGEAAQRS
jgi:hypothetical protein